MNSKLRIALVGVATAALVLLGAAPPVSAATVSGQVTLDGVGFEAEVHVFPEVGPSTSFMTNADGTYLLGGLDLGNYTLSVFADTAVHQGFVSPQFAISDAGDAVTMDLPLVSWPTGTSSIEGYVRDAGTLAPLAGASITFHGNGQAATRTATSDALGAFTFTDLPAGVYPIGASGPFGPPEYVGAFRNISVGEGTNHVMFFDLVLANSQIRVHAEDGLGNPIEGLYWFAELDSDPTIEVNPPLPTDVFGNADSNPMGAGTYTVRIGGDLTDWVAQTKTAVAPADGFVQVDFVLEPRPVGGLTGILVDASSAPLEDICVDILDAATGDAVATPSGPIKTGADGAFVRDDVTPGTYTLRFWDCDFTRDPAYTTIHLGGSPSFAHATTFTIALGDTTALGNLELGFGATISGHMTVEAADGPVEFPAGRGGFDVTIFQLVDGVWEAFPDPSPFVGGPNPGDFDARGLPAGTYRAGWFDPLSGPRSYADEYWNNQPTIGTASDIVVTAGGSATADVLLAIPRPSGVPDPVATADLAAADEDEISTNTFAIAGDDIEIEIDEDFAGEWMAAFGHSTPVLFGDWAKVSSTGAVTVPIPATMPAGVHTLVVQNAEGEVMGWTTITIGAAADPGGLAATGATTLWLVPAGVLIVLLGAALLIVRRRSA